MNISKKIFPTHTLMLAVLVIAGCTTIGITRPKATEYSRTYTYAISQKEKTALGNALKGATTTKNKGKSGFKLLQTGTESLETRLALIEAAQKTLDLQYYAANSDITTNLLFKDILDAADRGIRVRFLIDSISMNQVGSLLTLLDGNKNIEIRVFNPPVTKDQGLVAIVGFFADITQADKRMHNKVFIADNQAAIIGGRNLGDEYFDEKKEENFQDLDILSVGAITDQVSKSFDSYWNSDESFPIKEIKPGTYSSKAIAKLKATMQKNWGKYQQEHRQKEKKVRALTERLTSGDVKFIWAKAEMIADQPEKIQKDKQYTNSKPLMNLLKLTDNAKEEFLIVSSYFVPKEKGIEWLSGIKKRGVDVKILTNSLSSTDVVAAYSGYREYCLDLIKSGITLYELKRRGERAPKQRVFATTAPPYAALHAKVYIIDRRDVFIGSFNLDPRSVYLNTEIAMAIHSPELAAQLVDMFNESTSPKNSYHLINDHGKVAWVTEKDGKTVTLHHEPEVSFWRKLQANLMSLLPIENKL